MLGVLRRAFRDGRQSVTLFQLPERSLQIVHAVDRGDAIEAGLEWSRPQPLDDDGVHARRVKGSDFPLSRALLVLPRFNPHNTAVENGAQKLLVLIEQLVERTVRGIVSGNLRALQPAAVGELVEIPAGRVAGIEVGAIEGDGLQRRLCAHSSREHHEQGERAEGSTIRVNHDFPPGMAVWRAVFARQASPHNFSEQSGSQHRSASAPSKDLTGSIPARSRISSANFSCTPKAGVTLNVTRGKALAAAATIRGMSAVEWRPGGNMYGETVTSVAPPSTQSVNPRRMSG